MAEAVSSEHPCYTDRKDEWRLLRDTIRGETAVKAAGEKYLPKPGGFKGEKDGGRALFDAYRRRAQVREIVQPAVQAMVAIIHQAEIKIDMPEQMAAIWEKATKDGLPLEAFHRRVTAELLETGRYSILTDAPEGGGDMPYLAGYDAEALINWADDRTMFVLDESGLVRDGFTWSQKDQYLALELIDGKYVGARYDAGGAKITEEDAEPTTAKGAALTEIPLVVMGPRDLSLKPETPPLIGIARAVIAMYQLSADYRWQLFMTGQETLFVINGDKPDRVGAGVVVELKGGSENNPPDAKYVGPDGTGIEAHRIAIQDEGKNAVDAGAKLFNTGDSSQESGYARSIRYTAETASILSIAHASCAGLEKALRYVALMMGLDPTKVTVTPPASLVDREMTPQEMTAILGLRDGGLISSETAYGNLQQGGVASPDRDWEQERDLIDKDEIPPDPELTGAAA